MVSTRPQSGPAWFEGMFLGVLQKSIEHAVGTNGIICVHPIKRRPDEEAYDIDLLNSIPGIPARPVPNILGFKILTRIRGAVEEDEGNLGDSSVVIDHAKFDGDVDVPEVL